MGPTEKFEQEFIDASIESERVPNHSEYSLPDAEGEALEPEQLTQIAKEYERLVIEKPEAAQFFWKF